MITKKDLEWLETLHREVSTMLTYKFMKVLFEVEDDISIRAKLVHTIAETLGKTLDEVTFPVNWQRFLRTKNCPNYLKELTTLKVNVYYPEIPFPEEKHWVSLDK